MLQIAVDVQASSGHHFVCPLGPEPTYVGPQRLKHGAAESFRPVCIPFDAAVSPGRRSWT
jgi:hypothetical protein